MELKCLRCGCEKAVKNGFIFGLQRYKCKKCGYQYTRTKPHGRSDHEKRTAVMLYASGMSMSMIAKIVGVSVQTVSRWIRTFYTKKMDEIPKMEPMQRVTLKKVLDYFQTLNKEELDHEIFVLSAKLPSGSNVKILVDNPNGPRKRKRESSDNAE